MPDPTREPTDTERIDWLDSYLKDDVGRSLTYWSRGEFTVGKGTGPTSRAAIDTAIQAERDVKEIK